VNNTVKGETDRTKEEASLFAVNNTVKGDVSSLTSMLSGSTVINLILQKPFQSF
jgi:hypothetical protein